jgi:hypothetical protein
MAESFNNHVYLLPIRNERRCEQNMITVDAIDRPAHRIDHEAPCHYLALNERVKLQFRIEGSLDLRFPTNSTATNKPRPRISPT